MISLFRILVLLWREERRSFLQGLALSCIVLAMGAALLGLSGWFITAAAAAGMVGIGSMFNVFGPSAMVRFLALGRTAARYGERLTTHDATLRFLTQIRIRLLESLLDSPFRTLERLRANAFLNRVTADIDALDGVSLRLFLPGLAGSVIIVLASFALWWLVHLWVALVVGFGFLILPSLVFGVGQKMAQRSSRMAEMAMQATRSRLIDLITARDDLIVFGQIQTAKDNVQTAQFRHQIERNSLDRIERRTGFVLDMTGTATTATALMLGTALVQAQTITPAQAAIGVFVSLALSETDAPIRRALSEIGRMIQAARRVLPALSQSGQNAQPQVCPDETSLTFHQVSFLHSEHSRPLFDPLSFSVAPGETVALTGVSGGGKSTALLMAAGCLVPTTGRVTLGGCRINDLPDDIRQDRIAMVPQRHALIAGTLAENLRLAAPDADDADLWRVLTAVDLAETVNAKGGLGTRLGFRGTGLSGGEARRLVLARALLRAPDVLLLDEPTEGLDPVTGASVMAGIRAQLPRAAILIAAHRETEISAADREISVQLGR